MNAPADLFDDELREDPAPPAELTPEEWKRVLGDQAFRCLVKPAQLEWAGARAVRCIACTHASTNGKHQNPWSAHCTVHRVMVSDTFPKLCREFARK